MRAVTGSGGRLHFGMVAGIKSERWPTSNRNPWPDCVGIRILLMAETAEAEKAWPHSSSVIALTLRVETPCTYISASVAASACSER